MTITDTPTTTTEELVASWIGSDAIAAVRAIAAAAVTRGTDPVRPTLGQVELSEADGKGRAVATDAYCLAIVPIAYHGEPTVLPVGVVTLLTKVTAAELKRAQHDPTWHLTITRDGDHFTAVVGGRDGTRTASDMVTGPYPAWGQLVAAAHAIEDRPVGLNPTLLARTAKVAKILNAETAPLVLVHTNGAKPTVWELRTSEAGTVTWLQMPVRF